MMTGDIYNRLVDGTVTHNCQYIVDNLGGVFRVKEGARKHLHQGLKVRFVPHRKKFLGEFWAGEIWIPRAGRPGNMSYTRI